MSSPKYGVLLTWLELWICLNYLWYNNTAWLHSSICPMTYNTSVSCYLFELTKKFKKWSLNKINLLQARFESPKEKTVDCQSIYFSVPSNQSTKRNTDRCIRQKKFSLLSRRHRNQGSVRRNLLHSILLLYSCSQASTSESCKKIQA